MGCCTSKNDDDDRVQSTSQPVRGNAAGASSYGGAQAGGQVVGAGSEPEEDMWYYIDLLKVLQGPFTTAQMKLWLNAGYLPDDLEVRLASETTYIQLKYRKHMIDSSFQPISQDNSKVVVVEEPKQVEAVQQQPQQAAGGQQPAQQPEQQQEEQQQQPASSPAAQKVDVQPAVVQVSQTPQAASAPASSSASPAGPSDGQVLLGTALLLCSSFF